MNSLDLGSNKSCKYAKKLHKREGGWGQIPKITNNDGNDVNRAPLSSTICIKNGWVISIIQNMHFLIELFLGSSVSQMSQKCKK